MNGTASSGGFVAALQARFPLKSLEYVKTFATTILVLVLLPVALLAILRHPLDVGDKAVRNHGIGA